MQLALHKKPHFRAALFFFLANINAARRFGKRGKSDLDALLLSNAHTVFLLDHRGKRNQILGSMEFRLYG